MEFAYETLSRSLYDVDHDFTSEHIAYDWEHFHLPLAKLHHAHATDWGIVQGLEVEGVPKESLITIHEGIAIDRKGAMISLASTGKATVEIENSDSAVSNIPVKFPLGSRTGRYYLTIEYREHTNLDEGSAGLVSLMPKLRLQSVEGNPSYQDDGNSIILALVDIKDGKLNQLLEGDNSHLGRRLVGQTVSALRINSSRVVKNRLLDSEAGTISPALGGGKGLFTAELTTDKLTTDTIHSKNFIGISDARLKTNVNPLTNVLARLEKVRGVLFDWQGQASATQHAPPQQIGVIAQEVEQVFPELVATTGGNDYKGVDYSKLTAVLLEGIKELKRTNDTLQRENQSLAERLSAVESRLFAGQPFDVCYVQK